MTQSRSLSHSALAVTAFLVVSFALAGVGATRAASPPSVSASHVSGATPSTVPEPGISRRIDGITCPKANDCWAVGEYRNALNVSKDETLHWQGGAWRVVKAPSPVGGSFLNGITCTSASDCVAVGGTGDYLDQPRVNDSLKWNGKAWKVGAMPHSSCGAEACSSSSLSAVACARRARCLSVGHADDTDVIYNVALSGSGSGWRLASPSWNIYGGDATLGVNGLNDVSCLPSGECLAVGNTGYGGDASGGSNEAFLWSSQKWLKSDVPSPGDTKHYGSGPTLNAVTCLSTTNCWAAGFYYVKRGIMQDEILHWNGAAWTVRFDPNMGGGKRSLEGLTCPSSKECWAVGDGPAGKNQIMGWNGSSWRVVAAPNPAGPSHLIGVACASSRVCWASGYFERNGKDFNEFLRWNGSSWSVMATGRPWKAQPNPAKPVAVANVKADGFSNPWGVAADSKHVWMTTIGAEGLVELNAGNGTVVKRIAGQYQNQPLASDGVHVWAASGRSGSQVSEINASTGKVVRVIGGKQYGFQNPLAIASDGAHVWVANGAVPFTITELKVATGALVRIIKLQGGGSALPQAITSDGKYVWLAYEGRGGVDELSAATGHLVRVIKGFAKRIYMPVTLYANGKDAWIVNDSSVTKVVESTGNIASITLYGNHEFTAQVAVVPGARYVWESSPDATSLIKLRLKG